MHGLRLDRRQPVADLVHPVVAFRQPRVDPVALVNAEGGKAQDLVRVVRLRDHRRQVRSKCGRHVVVRR
jgi:hypothetical protein